MHVLNINLPVEQAKNREKCSRRLRDAMGGTSLDNSAIKKIKKDEPIIFTLL
jgi:hypothetical protein